MKKKELDPWIIVLHDVQPATWFDLPASRADGIRDEGGVDLRPPSKIIMTI